MKTNRLFEKDTYLDNIQTKALDVYKDAKNPSDALLILEDTIFFPGGGGQSCDTGKINGFEVSDVYEADGEIIHRISDGASLIDSGDLKSGTLCDLSLDWNHRFDNMQRHCGEHILSGVFFDLYKGINRGFHIGEDYMTIDISLEDNSDFSEITWEMALEAELQANRRIWLDLPVVKHHFDTQEEASKMPVRKAVAVEKDITIVTIGDPTHPADSVACCGTHPSSSGQVGLIKLYKVEPNKGMTRIYFDAGERALSGYRERFEILTALERDLSAGTPDLLEKYRSKGEKNREIRDRLYHLTQEVCAREKDKILADMSTHADVAAPSQADTPNPAGAPTQADTPNPAAAGAPAGVRAYRYDLLTIDDIIGIGRALAGSISGLLFLVHNPTNTVLLFSDDFDCGKLVKDNASVFNGKGGGNNTFARAIFNRPDDTDLFIDAITKLTS